MPKNKSNLDWRTLIYVVGPEPAHRNDKRVGCQVNVASAGFDPRTGLDRVRWNYRLGWVSGDLTNSATVDFQPVSYLPRGRLVEFMNLMAQAVEEGDNAYYGNPQGTTQEVVVESRG